MVSTKAEMFQLLQLGVFGNHTRVWSTPDDFAESGFRGLVGVRCVGKPGGPFYPSLTPQQALVVSAAAEAQGYHPMISEFTPTHPVVMNAELTRTEIGLVLFYSRAQTHMRPALKTAEHATMLEAKVVLEQALTPASYDDIMELLDLYQDHVIEFTVFPYCCGECRGRNHVVWEVRSY